MVFWTTSFLSSFTELWKKKAYYEKNSWIVNGVILRYQQNKDTAACILQSLFDYVFQLKSWNEVTLESLRTFAIKKSLLSVLQPWDSEMIYSWAENIESWIIWDIWRLEYNELIALLWTLSLKERVFYNAVVIDQLPIDQISLWTWFSTSNIEKIVNHARNILTQNVNDDAESF